MSEPTVPVPASDANDSLDVLALLVCREVQNGRNGVSLREIVEIVPVLAFPGEAGPLAFAAFVRPHRVGEAAVSFRIYPMEHPETTAIEMPGRLSVQKGYEGRQTVISAGFKTLKINAGGWFGLEFRLGQKVLARTRFAVGAINKQPAAGAAPATE
jgi:hypothetical protein